MLNFLNDLVLLKAHLHLLWYLYVDHFGEFKGVEHVGKWVIHD